MQLPSPALVVDLAVFDANVDAAGRLVGATGKTVRPHFKTHRVTALGRRQQNAHTHGFTCATVGEAERLVERGLDDILLANEVVSGDKVRRLARAARHARLTVAVDSAHGVRRLSEAVSTAGASVDVLVDVDIGLGRCGVRTVDDALALATLSAESRGLRLAGIMGYEGRIRTEREREQRLVPGYRLLGTIHSRLVKAGLACDWVSAGGTSSLPEALRDPVITEIQAGTYALMEPDREGPGIPFRCAARVSATVISRSGERGVVDAGRKTVGCDSGPPVPLDPDAEVVAVSEEHIVLRWRHGPPELGTRVDLRPAHVRTTFNLHDRVWLWDGERHTAAPVDARGTSA